MTKSPAASGAVSVGERVAIIDCGSGNLRSVEKALARAAEEAGLAASVAVTDDPDAVARADRIVLPGVGAFGACMAGLAARDGMRNALEEAVRKRGAPYLGLCVGMQILADCGHEFGETPGLGWIGGDVRPLAPAPGRPVPHMGWNEVTFDADVGPFARGQSDDYYFVHSFHFDIKSKTNSIGFCDYGAPLTAAVANDNIAGVQFHPEKSQAAGLALLADFLRWRP